RAPRVLLDEFASFETFVRFRTAPRIIKQGQTIELRRRRGLFSQAKPRQSSEVKSKLSGNIGETSKRVCCFLPCRDQAAPPAILRGSLPAAPGSKQLQAVLVRLTTRRAQLQDPLSNIFLRQILP